jgi:hypothetical protein
MGNKFRKPKVNNVPPPAELLPAVPADEASDNSSDHDAAAKADAARIRDFIGQIRPLDLIVFRGAEGVSVGITNLEKQKLGSSEISHVEVAITREWCPLINISEGDVGKSHMLSWGSTMSGGLNDGVGDVETGGSTFGVQFRDMEKLVTAYLSVPGANVGLCRLVNNPTVQAELESDDAYRARSAKLREKLCEAYTKFHLRTYDANPFALLGALYPQLRPLRTAAAATIGRFCAINSWVFCSEFVAELYIAAGVIDDSTDGKLDGKVLDPQNVVPVDFIGFDGDKDGIVNPICETRPIWIKPLPRSLRRAL